MCAAKDNMAPGFQDFANICPNLAGDMLPQVIEHTVGWMRKRPGQQVFRARFSAISGPEINAAMVRFCDPCVLASTVCLSSSIEALTQLCAGQLVKICLSCAHQHQQYLISEIHLASGWRPVPAGSVTHRLHPGFQHMQGAMSRLSLRMLLLLPMA